MGLLDKIVDDIFDPREPRRNRPRDIYNDDKMYIGDLLGSYFYKEDIQSFCEDADLKTTGTKDKLIERLLADSECDVTYFLDALDVDQLKELCDRFGERVSGTKIELIQRIDPHIEMKPAPVPATQPATQPPQIAPATANTPSNIVAGGAPQPSAPPGPIIREDELRRAQGLEHALLFAEAIDIYKTYEMWDDVRRCNFAKQQALAPQTKIQIGAIDQSTHSTYSDNRNLSSITNMDNRDAVINRSHMGGTPQASRRMCPYCGRELNYPEPPRFCPYCARQLLP